MALFDNRFDLWDNGRMKKFERLPNEILSRMPDVRTVLSEDADVIFAYLFGGLAKGDVKPLSDIDIAVYLKNTQALADYKIKLFDNLTHVLGTSELDLVILNTAPISLTGRIIQNRQVLIDKEPFRRHAFESLTLRKYFDFRMKEEGLFLRRYGIGR